MIFPWFFANCNSTLRNDSTQILLQKEWLWLHSFHNSSCVMLMLKLSFIYFVLWTHSSFSTWHWYICTVNIKSSRVQFDIHRVIRVALELSFFSPSFYLFLVPFYVFFSICIFSYFLLFFFFCFLFSVLFSFYTGHY